jgi:hypothetical protein
MPKNEAPHPILKQDLTSAIMARDESMRSSTAGSNHLYANIMRKQPLMNPDRIWMITHVLYEYLVTNKPGESDTLSRWEIGPDADNIVPVMTAALNLATRATWSDNHPPSDKLIRHVRLFELARALDDLLLDSTKDAPMSDMQRQAAMEAAHAEMSYADDWIENEIGWRPFSKFHDTDQKLIDTATTHVPEFAKLLSTQKKKPATAESMPYKISEMRKATFKTNTNKDQDDS